MSPTLLVTDDSMIIREIIKDIATQDGWNVIAEASNGLEAINLYRDRKPDAVTLDLVMPEYDGLSALRGIREIDGNAKVLIVSAIDQQEILIEAVRLGATDFIVKPFEKGRMRGALALLAENLEASATRS
jgi:two-component system chemotaxis response regulator CheY